MPRLILKQMNTRNKIKKLQKAKIVIYTRATFAVMQKDLRVEIRSRELLSSLLVFALLSIIIFNFTLEFEPTFRSSITSGILWVTFVFAGTLGLNRSLALEKDRGCLDGLLLAPVDRSAIFIGKMMGNLILMLVAEIIILLIYSVLYNINLFQGGLLIVFFLGSFGFITVGTLLSSMAVQTRTRELLLPILLFPVILPVLLAATKACNGFISGYEIIEILPWIYLLIAYDLIFLAVGLMMFEYILEE